MQTRGITLIELLVGMAILGVLVLAFTQFFTSTLQVTGEFEQRNELLAEGQLAQQLVVSRLQEAWYVYPEGSSVNLTQPAAWQITNPASGSTSWTVGPIFVAGILPPVSVGAPCAPADPTQTTGCYRFIAFYPIARAEYVANTAGDLLRRLLPDAANPAAWVLVQYSGFLAAGAVTQGSTAPTAGALATMGGVRVDLLADYITPGSTLFEVVEVTDDPRPTQQVTVRLELQRVARGRTITLGSPGVALNTVVLPRNQGVLAP